jgi:hypothetical protein
LPAAEFFDQSRTQHQFVADQLGFSRRFFHGGNKKLRNAHEKFQKNESRHFTTAAWESLIGLKLFAI